MVAKPFLRLVQLHLRLVKAQANCFTGLRPNVVKPLNPIELVGLQPLDLLLPVGRS